MYRVDSVLDWNDYSYKLNIFSSALENQIKFRFSVTLIDDASGAVIEFTDKNEFRSFIKKSKVLGVTVTNRILICTVSKVASKMMNYLNFDGDFLLGNLNICISGLNFLDSDTYMMFINESCCALDYLIKEVRKNGGLNSDDNYDIANSVVRLLGNNLYIINAATTTVFRYTVTDKSKFLSLLNRGIVLNK